MNDLDLESLVIDSPTETEAAEHQRILKDLADFDWKMFDSVMKADAIPAKTEVVQPVNGTRLPILMYFSHNHKLLPAGRVYAVFMHLGKPSNSDKQPRYKGSVFVIPPTIDPPSANMEPDALYHWALDVNNCPISLRFRSISFAITQLIGLQNSPYRKKFDSLHRYKHAKKTWKIAKTNKLLETILKNVIECPIFDPVKVEHNRPYERRRRVGGASSSGKKDSVLGKRSCPKCDEVSHVKRLSTGNDVDPHNLSTMQVNALDSSEIHVLLEKLVDRKWGAFESKISSMLRECVQNVLRQQINPTV